MNTQAGRLPHNQQARGWRSPQHRTRPQGQLLRTGAALTDRSEQIIQTGIFVFAQRCPLKRDQRSGFRGRHWQRSLALAFACNGLRQQMDRHRVILAAVVTRNRIKIAEREPVFLPLLDLQPK